MTTTVLTQEAQALRALVHAAMADLAIPESTPNSEPPTKREDGVLEFYKHWRVRGESAVSGLFATYSDHDDLIEFGLTERDGEIVTNVLQASIVLDGGEFNVVSEVRDDFNFDAIVTPEQAQPLDDALRFFVTIFRGA
jgi:hypothetical protein